MKHDGITMQTKTMTKIWSQLCLVTSLHTIYKIVH